LNRIYVDTSTETLYFALKKGEKTISCSFGLGFSHTENLAAIFDSYLKMIDLKVEEIDEIVIGEGPGSFTGIRIAFAFLKGVFSGSKESKFILLPLLEAVYISEKPVYGDFIYAPFYFGRKNRYYSCCYDNYGNLLHNLADLDAESLINKYFKIFSEKQYNKIIISCE